MNAEFKALLFSLLWRFLPAGALFLLGTAILLAYGPVGGFGLYLAASILLAFPLANLLANAWNNLLWSRSFNERPQPMYGIPQSRRIKGLPEEAIAEYEKILAAHPSELRPWLDMIAIAIEDLKAPNLAQDLFERGVAFLKNPDDRDILAQTYAAIRTRLDVRPPRPPLHLHSG